MKLGGFGKMTSLFWLRGSQLCHERVGFPALPDPFQLDLPLGLEFCPLSLIVEGTTAVLKGHGGRGGTTTDLQHCWCGNYRGGCETQRESSFVLSDNFIEILVKEPFLRFNFVF